MGPTVPAAPTPQGTGSPPAARLARTLVAGVVAAAAAMLSAAPSAPPATRTQQHPVHLVGADDALDTWQQVFTSTTANLQALEGSATAASTRLAEALGTSLSGYSGQISAAFTGAAEGVQNSIYGGWYGGDDGYVFGLFGGSVTNPATGITESGSTLQEISTALGQGNLFNAFGYLDTWALESLDHTLKPLLNPLLTVTSHGVTSVSTGAQLLQTLTNLDEALLTYTNLKSIGEGVLAPQIGVALGLGRDLDAVTTALSSGDVDQALTNIANIPANLVNNLLNGFVQVNPVDGTSAPFGGLLNSGSLLNDLLVDWPNQLATALSGSAPDVAASIDPADIAGLALG